MTLYELATGICRDGATARAIRALLDCEITIDAELFDASIRDRLAPSSDSFRRETGRAVRQRRRDAPGLATCFKGIEQPGRFQDRRTGPNSASCWPAATFDTPIAELGLGTRATNALDRVNILTVETCSPPIGDSRGFGAWATRPGGRSPAAVKILRERLGNTPTRRRNRTTETRTKDFVPAETMDSPRLRRGPPAGAGCPRTAREGETIQRTLHMLLGLDPAAHLGPWPSQSDVASLLGVNRVASGRSPPSSRLAGRRTRPSRSSSSDPSRHRCRFQGGVIWTVPELVEAVIL